MGKKHISLSYLFKSLLLLVSEINSACVPITLRVKAEYSQQSLRSAYRHTKTIQSSPSFKNVSYSLSISPELNGVLKSFSSRAAAAYEEVTKLVSETTNDTETLYKIDKTIFNKKYSRKKVQLIEEITTEISLEDTSAKIFERNIKNSVSPAYALSPGQLKQIAKVYINHNYGNIKEGHINGTTYTESVCSKSGRK